MYVYSENVVALPSAEICVTARPPLLETLETVEAPQLPGRMALRQHAQLAALPTRSLGERAFPHGKDPPQSVSTAGGVYSHFYSFFVLYTGIHLAHRVPRRLQRYTALQRYTVYSGIHSPSDSLNTLYIPRNILENMRIFPSIISLTHPRGAKNERLKAKSGFRMQFCSNFSQETYSPCKKQLSTLPTQLF